MDRHQEQLTLSPPRHLSRSPPRQDFRLNQPSVESSNYDHLPKPRRQPIKERILQYKEDPDSYVTHSQGFSLRNEAQDPYLKATVSPSINRQADTFKNPWGYSVKD